MIRLWLMAMLSFTPDLLRFGACEQLLVLDCLGRCLACDLSIFHPTDLPFSPLRSIFFSCYSHYKQRLIVAGSGANVDTTVYRALWPATRPRLHCHEPRRPAGLDSSACRHPGAQPGAADCPRQASQTANAPHRDRAIRLRLQAVYEQRGREPAWRRRTKRSCAIHPWDTT